MEQQIKGVYDLTENCRDVWGSVNFTSDNEPTNDELSKIREIIISHYHWVAKRLGEGHRVSIDGGATWTLKVREGREVSDFKGGRFTIPDFLEVEANASPTMEMLIQQELKPPAPDVK